MASSIDGSSLGTLSVDSAPRGKRTIVNKPGMTKLNSKTHAQLQQYSEPFLLAGSAQFNKTSGDADLPLRIEPHELRFDSIEPGILYVMTFSVRNTTKVAQRIRIEPPKTSLFALNYIPTGAVAPGLDVRAEVECQLPERSSGNFFKDSIVAVMGPYKVELPLYASKPAPDISFDTLVNLGLVVEGQPGTGLITFENVGAVVGRVTIKSDERGVLKFDPSTFDIIPKKSGRDTKVIVNVRFEGKDLGVFREFVQVLVEGNPEPMTMDISATVVQQKLVLLSQKKGITLDFLDFGSTFYGKTVTKQGTLVNNGPQTVNFNIIYSEDEDMKEILQPPNTPSFGASLGTGDDTLAAIDRPISITPAEGTLKPYTQTAITFRFNPKLPVPPQGFQKQFQRDLNSPKVFSGKAMIENPDNNQSSVMIIQGMVMMPKLVVNPTILRFGLCSLYDRRDILVTITSQSVVPVHFDFSKIALFKVNPNNGIIHPKETISAVFSFLPSQLGKFKNTLKLIIEDGVSTIDIRVMGEAIAGDVKKQLVGGTNKLPEDFNPVYKFVQPAPPEKSCEDSLTGSFLSEFSRLHPTQRKDFESSTSWDESQRESGERSIHKDEYTYSFQQLQKRSLHKQQYDQFLSESHKIRIDKKQKMLVDRLEARGIVTKDNPFGVDMGIESGLQPPELKLPVGGEPLWLERRVGDDVGGRGRRIPIDENRLIIKKHSDAPSTQAEMRDCSKSLSLEEIRSVIPSHKVLNFGRVCVTSVMAKNFVITNDLNHSVIVHLHWTDQELKQSKPEIQVIPQGGVAGFDIYFSCREVCKFKKFITWTINGQHSNKLMVVAEVVNIELTMDRTTVNMSFPATSLERSHTDQMTLTNPGNAPAEYLWTSQGAFQCRPDTGVIEPGKSIPVTIIWTPSPSHTNEDNVGLHVVGGQDQFLTLYGHLKDCRALFEEKKLLLGTLAVGQERKLTAHIKNTGTNPAVFHFDPPLANVGLEIHPMCGCIPIGDSFEIEVTVKPKIAMSYENVGIVAGIRGGKAIVSKFSGESKMPNISLVEESFRIGPVVVGSSYRVPLTLVNNGNFNATLMLDLSDHMDLRPCLAGEPRTKFAMKSIDDAGNVLEPTFVAPSSNNSRASSEEAPSGMWRITLNPNATLKGELVFLPTSARSHNFKLPLYVHGQTTRPYPFDVTAEGLQSRLSVSTFCIDFGDRVVSRDPSSRMTYFKEFTFTSVDTTSTRLNFEIREKVITGSRLSSARDGGNPVYFISPTKGELMTGESIAVRVTFLPQGHGDFTKEIDVYVSGQPDASRPYFTLLCRGSGVFPRLTFTKHRLVLPNVPLGTTSRNSFDIINNGYDNLELNYRVSPTIPVPLIITFPLGSDVGLTREKATVVIAAKSDVPISWYGKVEFYDTDGEKFSIDVCGCSDGCLLTVYPFIKQYKDRYGFLALEQQPAIFLSKKEIAALRMQETKRKETQRRQRAQERQKVHGKMSASDSLSRVSKGSSKDMNDDELLHDDIDLAYEGIDLEREIPTSATDYECRFLLLWMNKFVCRKPIDVNRYPESITDVHGDNIIDCIEMLSGKKVVDVRSGVDGQGTSSSRRSSLPENETASEQRMHALDKLLKKYRALLSFLIRSGALLTHINPLLLLGQEDYMFALEIDIRRQEGDRMTAAMLTERKEHGSDAWLQGCKEAWAEILFQIFKVYMLSRVTYKEYKDTPGIIFQESSEDEADNSSRTLNSTSKKGKKGPTIPPQLKSSNVYTQAEAILFEWACYHMRHASTMEDSGVGGDDNQSTQMFALDRRVSDLDEDLKDLSGFCQIFHSHLAELTKPNGVLFGYSVPENKTPDKLFVRLQKTFSQYRLDFEIEEYDLVTSSRSLLLMLVHMFLTVPPLIPKTTIEFKGVLGAPIQKCIELKNPSNRRVSYRVTLEGNPDFSTAFESIVIDPQSAVDFELTCNARFSSPAAGRITFWGVREKGSGPSTMVFKLISNIVDRKPVEVKKKTASLFDHETFEITIVNPFDVECIYPITIHQIHDRMSLFAATGIRAEKGERKKISVGAAEQSIAALLSAAGHVTGAGISEDEEETKRILEQPIWCNEHSIHLLPKQTGTITVNVLPFMLGKYSAQIVMMEPTAGEFCYQVDVEVGAPKVTEKLEFTVPQVGGGGAIQRALRIAPKNPAFEHAAGIAAEVRFSASRRIRGRSLLQQFLSYTGISEDNPGCTFGVDIQSPYFNAQKEFNCVSEYVTIPKPQTTSGNKNPPSTADPSKRVKIQKNCVEELTAAEIAQPHPSLNTVQFSFFPEKAGIYKSRVVVYCKENEFDFRVFEIMATVSTPELNAVLEFKGSAKQVLTQEIPIVNESNRDWQLQSIIHGKGFTGAKSVNLRKGEKTMYSVSFTGQYPGSFDGSLLLRDPASNDSFEYKLVGVADEPLAEDNLSFKCLARAKQTFKIPLKQMEVPKKFKRTGNQTFKVETDLMYVSGASTVEVPPQGGEYVFTVMSPVGGVMTGSITFMEMDSGVIIWYTVEIEVTSPQAESTINIEAVVRKAVVVEITIDNPTNSALDLQVGIEGEGLLGDVVFTLPPRGENIAYELIYSPLVAGKSKGSISFMNDKVGEFWYHLNLLAIPAPPTTLDVIECMLGSSKGMQVPLENPLDEMVTLNARVSDPDHFAVLPEGQITLEPYSQTTFDLVFRPSSLTETMYSTVTFSHPAFGELLFAATGKGLLPGVMSGIDLYAPLLEIGSQTLLFRNPFLHPLPVDVYLSDSMTAATPSASPANTQRSGLTTDRSEDRGGPKKAFGLLLRKSHGIVIAARSSLQIGVSFTPQKLGQYNSIVQVRSNVSGRNLLWCFPVTGVAEAGSPQVLPKLTTKCKMSLIKDVIIPLQGLRPCDLEPDETLDISSFTLDLVIDSDLRAQVNRAFRMQPLGLIQMTKDDPNTDFGLSFRLLLEPLRVFRTTVQVMIMCKGKGRWRAEIDLEAQEPVPDDTITLTAAVGSMDKVSFRLSNRFLGYSSFHAYFSAHSSTHFSVSPTTGVLAPYGSDGTQFIVSFSPLEYGGREQAILNIVTDDTQWTYEIIGTYPELTAKMAQVPPQPLRKVVCTVLATRSEMSLLVTTELIKRTASNETDLVLSRSICRAYLKPSYTRSMTAPTATEFVTRSVGN
eukprot:gene4748-9429_t